MFYTIVGFGLAGYSVIANDSIQTLGTFIASKQKWFKWYTLASTASFVMILAIVWSWYSNEGDISYGRLTISVAIVLSIHYIIIPKNFF